MTKSYTRYICVFPDGSPVGIDKDSYPWRPYWNGEPSFGFVQQYWTAEAAQNYIDMFKNLTNEKLLVKKITITIED